MVTRKVDFRWFPAPQWCLFAIVLSGTTVALGQAGENRGDVATSEQRLFPKGLPKIEVMLREALEQYTDVLAARSKVRAAEAEQRQAELRALKDMMMIRDRWEKANNLVSAVASGNPADLRSALANQAAIEWELAFLLGSRGTSLAESPSVSDAGKTVPNAAAVAPVVIDSVVPAGDQAASIQKILKTTVDMGYDDAPLRDVATFLSEQSGLRIVLDNESLEEEGLSGDYRITCELGEMELVAALQALEDLQRPLYFVVRDYGILVTTKGRRSSETVSVQDFAKLSDRELRDKLQQQRQEESERSRNGGMQAGNGIF